MELILFLTYSHRQIGARKCQGGVLDLFAGLLIHRAVSAVRVFGGV